MLNVLEQLPSLLFGSSSLGGNAVVTSLARVYYRALDHDHLRFDVEAQLSAAR